MIERLNVQPVSVIVHMDRYLIGPENLSLNAKEEFAELCRSSGSSIGAEVFGKIDKPTSKYFIKQGHNVIGVSRKLTKIKSKKFFHISYDLNNFDKYDELFKKIHKKFGKINNVLFSAGIQFIMPTTIISKNDIDRILNINLKSPLLFSKFISNKFLCPPPIILICFTVVFEFPFV